MKQILLILFTGLLVGCQYQEVDNVASESSTRSKIVVFHIDDYSQSTDNNICYYDSSTARNLYMFLASQEEAVIKHAGIYSTSLDQQIFTLPVQTLDTTTTNSKNVYIAAKDKNKKQKAVAEFQTKAEQDISRYIVEIYKPRNSKYSDINGVCQLLSTTLTQPNWAGYNKYVIFSSDMRNHEPGKRESRIYPVHLPNTQILCVRPSISRDSLYTIFPESDIEVFTDANDIISFLKSKHQ